MSKHTYPRQMPAEWSLTNNRPYSLEKTCDGCKQPFASGQVLCIIETQVSWFRGDDEVEFFCQACAGERGFEPPEKVLRSATAGKGEG